MKEVVKMAEANELLETLGKLAKSLQENHPDAKTTDIIIDTLSQLKGGEGIASIIPQFLAKVPIAKMTDGIKFNDHEQGLWDQLLEGGKQLGSNLLGGFHL